MNVNTNSIVPFEYDSHQIRSITIEDQPYFIAQDVCDVLAIVNGKDIVRRQLDEDEKLKRQIVASGQNRETWLVNESGLYTLIMRSNKPEAKAFRKWVTSEVLPALRKTGSYYIPHPYDEAIKLAKQAIELAGSQNKLGKRLGISSAHMSYIMNRELWHLVSDDMILKVEQGCRNILQHGMGYDQNTVDLLMKIEDNNVRTELYNRLKKGGVL